MQEFLLPPPLGHAIHPLGGRQAWRPLRDMRQAPRWAAPAV